jgi:hypothetical protein
MSSGEFSLGFYEGDSGEKHLIRYQPETAIFSLNGTPNTLPAGPATSIFWAKVTKGKTEYGMAPRKIRIKWTGQPPADYADCETLEIVVFSLSVYNGATVGANATYLETPAQIIGKIPENVYPVT